MSNNRVQGTRHKVSGPLTRDVRPEKMNIRAILISMAFLLPPLCANAESIDLYLKDKVDFCALVAVIRVDHVNTYNDEDLRLPVSVLNCTITQTFKAPPATPLQISIPVAIEQDNIAYESNTFLLFGFQDADTISIRPFGGQEGLIARGHAYRDYYPPYPKQIGVRERIIPYDRLIEEISILTKTKQGEQSVPGYPPQGVGSPEP